MIVLHTHTIHKFDLYTKSMRIAYPASNFNWDADVFRHSMWLSSEIQWDAVRDTGSAFPRTEPAYIKTNLS